MLIRFTVVAMVPLGQLSDCFGRHYYSLSHSVPASQEDGIFTVCVCVATPCTLTTANAQDRLDYQPDYYVLSQYLSHNKVCQI